MKINYRKSNLLVLAVSMMVALYATKPIASTISAMISKNEEVLTMVNVITPPQGQQLETIADLRTGMSVEMAKQPGFISSTIHRSLDSEHIVVYAQWEDQASVEAAVKVIQSGGAPSMGKVFATANAEFHPYRVDSVHIATQ